MVATSAGPQFLHKPVQHSQIDTDLDDDVATEQARVRGSTPPHASHAAPQLVLGPSCLQSTTLPFGLVSFSEFPRLASAFGMTCLACHDPELKQLIQLGPKRTAYGIEATDLRIKCGICLRLLTPRARACDGQIPSWVPQLILIADSGAAGASHKHCRGPGLAGGGHPYQCH